MVPKITCSPFFDEISACKYLWYIFLYLKNGGKTDTAVKPTGTSNPKSAKVDKIFEVGMAPPPSAPGWATAVPTLLAPRKSK